MGHSFHSFFVGNLLLLAVAMKCVSLKLVTTNQRHSAVPLVELLARQFFFFLISLFSWKFLSITPLPIASYGAFFLIWSATEWWGATIALMGMAQQRTLIHHRPWLSRSLSDFWGRRWNRWVGSWLMRVSRQLLPRTTHTQLWGAFLISGLGHELMFALPYYVATGVAHFGPMTLYFLLQPLGITLEKRYLRGTPRSLQRLWAWSWIVLPLPLFTHGPFLALIGIIQ